MFGDPGTERVVVTHHTLVAPGEDGANRRPPRLAAELPALQDRLLAGDRIAAEGFTDDRPCQWVRSFHPAFQVRLHLPSGEGHGYRRCVDFATGVVRTECADRTREVFVSRADDVIVQRVTAPGRALGISLGHGLPAPPPIWPSATAPPSPPRAHC